MNTALTAADLLQMFLHFTLMSLLSVGGAITTTPDIHRYLVHEHHWLTDAQFTDSIALAQAAPGPNLLFIAVLGWNVAGPLGVVAAMSGILLPSSTIAWTVTRWGQRRPDHPAVRIFTNGFTPLTVGLLLSTGWVLSQPVLGHGLPGGVVLIGGTVGVMLRTKLSPMWLIGLGAVVGALGWA
jgi:chromate transporter